jgi:hypothetical protein
MVVNLIKLATSAVVGGVDLMLDDQVAAGKFKQEYQDYLRIGLAAGGTLVNYFISLGPTLDDVTEAIALSSIPLAEKSAKRLVSGVKKYSSASVREIELLQRAAQMQQQAPAPAPQRTYLY